jgi:hypothetical protein
MASCAAMDVAAVEKTDSAPRRPDGLVRARMRLRQVTFPDTRRCRHADCGPRTRKGRRLTRPRSVAERETKHEGSTSLCRDRPCRRSALNAGGRAWGEEQSRVGDRDRFAFVHGEFYSGSLDSVGQFPGKLIRTQAGYALVIIGEMSILWLFSGSEELRKSLELLRVAGTGRQGVWASTIRVPARSW